MEGKLVTYEKEKRLTAFLSPSPANNVPSLPYYKTNFLVIVGGLTDGLMALPYLKPLSERLGRNDWIMVQPLLSSSYVGYGSSSIMKDVEELTCLISFLRELYSGSEGKMFVMGHSTGAADALYLSRCVKLDGVILQGPVSDRLFATENLTDYQDLLTLAKKMQEDGRGDEWMPRRADPNAAITANRFACMLGKGTIEDIFSPDLDEIPKVWLDTLKGCKINVILSEKDEYCNHLERVIPYFEKVLYLTPNEGKCHVIKDADHAISQPESQAQFLDILLSILLE